MRIPSKTIENVIQTATANIVEVISEYVELKKKGQNWWGLSPFKNEKTPSFAVSPSKGIYKCFSTGKGGGVVNFLMEMDGLSFYEAILTLAKKFNIPVELENTPYSPDESAKKDSIYILNDFALQFFLSQLESSREAQEYLEKRGVYTDIRKKFQIGYAPKAKNEFAQTALKNFFKEEYLLESGLSLKNENNQWIDRFRHRIMFPIKNLQGKIIGFGGRILGSSQEVAKYINSPDSIVYNKSYALYGIFEAKEAIRKKQFAILSEGYLDVITLHQHGFENAVASCGTAFTNEQARLIKRFAPQITILYDGDEAGVKAALKALNVGLEEDLNVKILILPAPEDPDSFLQKFGKEALQNLLQNQAVDGVQFKLDYLKKQFNIHSPQDKLEIIKEITDTLSKIKDDLKKALYIQQIAQQLEVSDNILNISIRQKIIENQKIEKISYERSQTKPTLTPYYDKEKELLRLFFFSGNKSFQMDNQTFVVQQVLLQKFQEAPFFYPEFEFIRNEILQNANQLENLNLKLLNHENPEISKIVADFIINVEKLSPHWEKYGILTTDLDNDPFEALNSAYLHYELEKLEKMIELNLEAFQKSTEDEQNHLLIRHKKLLQLRDELHKKLGIIIPPGKISY